MSSLVTSSAAKPSIAKSLAECEKSYLIKIRKQYDETKNFQNSAIAAHCMDFKDQQHQNCFDELCKVGRNIEKIMAQKK